MTTGRVTQSQTEKALVAVGVSPQQAAYYDAGVSTIATLGGASAVNGARVAALTAPRVVGLEVGQRVTTGETFATATGKSVHAELAAARRASGDFDLVNSPLLNASGSTAQVPSRVNLITGEPAIGSELQLARPDAVRFSNRLILDDKPFGRALSKSLIRN